ncbi:MAG TPA: RNA-binding S4 domain-containing protein [Saprospiraceae bacterium]|nr:RNA-binding S4 domain-containing protein [Saprospiraceae bacterium]
METFYLKEHEYIELNKLLKLVQLVETGGEANNCIQEGEVIVNGEVELRKRHKLRDGFVVEFRERKIIIQGILHSE